MPSRQKKAEVGHMASGKESSVQDKETASAPFTARSAMAVRSVAPKSVLPRFKVR